jgi:hypothetical protein
LKHREFDMVVVVVDYMVVAVVDYMVVVEDNHLRIK